MNEIEIFFIFGLNELKHSHISFKAVFTFKITITFNMKEFMRFHTLNSVKWYVK
jgi:hypothetical protein